MISMAIFLIDQKRGFNSYRLDANMLLVIMIYIDTDQ